MKTTHQKDWPVAIKTIVWAMASAGLATLPYMAYANPTGGQVVAGDVSIRQESASKIGITQTTDKGIIDWQKYSIGANEHVQYYQPSASSITLNRVIGQDPSQILGRLTANGQVFLVNPNGIYFGKNAQVDVAGLVATTHNIRNEDFLAGNYHFNIPGKPGASVINEGTIRIADTGIAAFIAPSVANRGVVVARLGKVAMVAANGYTLDFHGDQLLSFLVADDVAQTAFDIDGKQLTSFVENSGRIEAQGGYVLLTAKAAESAIHGVINQSGVIEATTVGTDKGEIILHAGKGSLEVSGTLDASAPNGGDGGFIETSGAQVFITIGTKVTTAAPLGKSGLWLIDPTDFTIDAGNSARTTSGIGASTLEAGLAAGDVTIETSADGSGNGDIFVNSAVGWSDHQLTLSAHRNININANLNGSGTAKLALNYGQGSANGTGGDYSLRNGAQVNLPAGENFSTKQGSSGAVKNFTVITLLGNEGSTTTTDLQGMNGNLARNYALGNDIEAMATFSWDAGHGFMPIGAGNYLVQGDFDGLGHAIHNLVINRNDMNAVGLFGRLGGEIRNLGLVAGAISGLDFVGGIAGMAFNKISSSYSTGTVMGRYQVGGLAGLNSYLIVDSFSTADVDGIIETSSQLGGLVGKNEGVIQESYAMGTVTGYNGLGGLVGYNVTGDVHESYATGAVTGNTYVGGLVGWVNYESNVYNNYSLGAIVGSTYVGGLIGMHTASYNYTVINNFWDTQTSNRSYSPGGTGKTTAEMQQQATYTDWDFVNTWVMLPGGYPILRNAPVQATVFIPPITPPVEETRADSINNIGYITNVTGSFSLWRDKSKQWVEVDDSFGDVFVDVDDFIDARNSSLVLKFRDGSEFSLDSKKLDLILQPTSGPSVITSIADSVLEYNSIVGRVMTSTGVIDYGPDVWTTGVRG